MVFNSVIYPVCVLHLQVIYPKSDTQRKRLVEAVGKMFLFKSLDMVNVVRVCNLVEQSTSLYVYIHV